MSNAAPSEAEVMSAIKKINRSDDRLGGYSDYEGGTHGPTWYFWNRGKEHFAAQVERAIQDHELAIKAWREMGKLNERR